jgi:O-succinylhomoserine sulfhydrylase
VLYPGLASHPQHALAMRQQSAGGAIVSFEVKGATPDEQRQNAFRVINAVEVMSVTGNLGDTRTTITHSATTTHGRLSEEARAKAGIRQSLIRIAVGLEDIEDLKADLDRGLSA